MTPHVVNLRDVKNFLRVEHDRDDRLIAGLMAAAEAYLMGAIGNFCDVTDPRAQFLMLIAIRDMYDNGEMSKKVSGNTEQLVSDFAQQLRLEG